MDQFERSRLTDAFGILHNSVSKFMVVWTVCKAIGLAAYKGRLSLIQVQKTIILLDKYRALDTILRSENGDKCPQCGGDHPSHPTDLFRDLRLFAIECSKDEIKCKWCVDLGWKHIFPGHCEFSGRSDEYHHIELCNDCNVFTSSLDAVNAHQTECGCGYFLESCRYYNDEDFNHADHEATEVHSSTQKLLEGDTDFMADLKAVATDIKNQSDKFKDVGVRFTVDGEKPVIVLPDGMEYGTARHWLEKIETEQNKQISIDHRFPGFYPPDAALALTKAIERTYGFASQESTRGFFSVIPPATIGIQADLNKIIQIPWGKMTFHGVGGHVTTNVTFVDGMPVMQLAGVIRKGDQDKIEKLVQLTHKILKEESIYRGKAVIIDFSNFDPDDPRFDPMKAPKFMDLSRVTLEDLVLSSDVGEMVRTNLFVPITHTEACRKAGIPLRRGVLLAGPFGTGKTLTAQVTAKLAVNNSWTYIYITDLKQLSQALAFAKNYGPAVIFGEDIDRITDGERDEKLDEYLNALDGVNRKHDEVLVVFTTNNVGNINPAMMRPGRIDAIIPIEAPDSAAARELLRKYGRDLISSDADLTKVGLMLDGQIPAVIREVVERSKLRAIRDADDDEDPRVTAIHLEQAATEMLRHVRYINPLKEETENPLAVLGRTLGEKIQEVVVGTRKTPASVIRGMIMDGQANEAIQQLVGDAVDGAKNGNGRTVP